MGFTNDNAMQRLLNRFRAVLVVTVAILFGVLSTRSGEARDMTLESAMDVALNHTAKGEMIRGDLEVARMKYSARRINLYLPEISINGSLPSYQINESYRPYSSSFDKQLYQERNLNYQSFIQLKQSLFTGGNLVAQANLLKEDNRYPDIRFDAASGLRVNENSQRGFLNLELEQPLFRPSSVKNDLHNTRDDFEIAKMSRIEDETALRKEVTEAYLGVLQQTLQLQIARDELERTTLKVGIDSAKLEDGVISEEDYLLSTSDRLDAELSVFDIETKLEESRREMRTLLDLEAAEGLSLAEPPLPDHFDSEQGQRYAAGWETTVPVVKAQYQFAKAERAAEFEASGHGLTGDLKASYSMGRQKIERERHDDSIEENINTSGWTVSLDFSLPIWDGGAGRASEKAAKYDAERARYEYTRARRSARASIINLVNQLDVSFERLKIISKQIELADNRLQIARDRYADGQISMLTLLETKVSYLQNKDRYLEELKSYLLNRIELQGKFIS